MIYAVPRDIAMVPSTAFAITLAASYFLQIDSRQIKVLLLQDEMCSAVYAWEHVCQQPNGDITLDIIPHPSTGGGWTLDGSSSGAP
jgi:selenocysteine lyase/cysteine desulfurase